MHSSTPLDSAPFSGARRPQSAAAPTPRSGPLATRIADAPVPQDARFADTMDAVERKLRHAFAMLLMVTDEPRPADLVGMPAATLNDYLCAVRDAVELALHDAEFARELVLQPAGPARDLISGARDAS